MEDYRIVHSLEQSELSILTTYYLRNLELFVQQLRTRTSKVESKWNYLFTWGWKEIELFISWKVSKCLFSGSESLEMNFLKGEEKSNYLFRLYYLRNFELIIQQWKPQMLRANWTPPWTHTEPLLREMKLCSINVRFKLKLLIHTYRCAHALASSFHSRNLPICCNTSFSS